MADMQALKALATSAAVNHGLPPEFLLALITVESGWNPWAWNPEPGYRYLVDCRTGRPWRELTPMELLSERPPKDFPALCGDRDQEWWGQQASFGLMQVMGALARELGFCGPFLTQLCEPQTCLLFGCRQLVRLKKKLLPSRGWAAVAATYNGGLGAVRPDGTFTNPEYPAKVLQALGGTWPEVA